MKKSLPRVVLTLVLAMAIAGVSVAVQPAAAHAVTTNWLYTYVKSKIAAIVKVNNTQNTSIARLNARAASAESSITALKAQTDNPGGGAFWPTTVTSIQAGTSDTQVFFGRNPDDAVTMISIVEDPQFVVNGKYTSPQPAAYWVYRSNNETISAGPSITQYVPNSVVPAPGTPIDLEYWVEAYGTRAHGVMHFTAGTVQIW